LLVAAPAAAADSQGDDDAGAGPGAGGGSSPTIAQPSPTRPVLVVSNNWGGTADFIDPKTFKRLFRLNIVPDKQERLAEIALSPDKQAYFLAIRQLVGEGHDQYVDDGFTSPDGRYLYVSRPSFADVVAIDLKTRKIHWRVPVMGYRADHMAISRDGRRLLVSASTANVVHEIDTQKGKIVGTFASGDSPHENNFSRDESRIFHASIGRVYTPTDDPSMEASKGKVVFEIVRSRDLKILRTIDMNKKLEEFGHPEMSGAVRPMALAPKEHFLYFQVSFFHGFVEYNLDKDRVTRLAYLPLSQAAADMSREDYLLDSAHHGLAMNHRGTKLCSAGTMDSYVAITSRRTFSAKIIPVGPVPYWATNNGDGTLCFVSVARANRVAVISYAKEEQVARIKVGYHPQRMRMGKVRRAFVP
jgi:DNA-binding beta-propeller fold protein YncE